MEGQKLDGKCKQTWCIRQQNYSCNARPGRKQTVGSHPPSLETWKLANNGLGKVIKDITINSLRYLHTFKAAARHCMLHICFIVL